MRTNPALPLATTIALLVIAFSSSFTAVHSLTWSTTGPVLVDWNNNLFPTVLQLSNGSVWVAFQKSSPTTGDDIYLMVHNGFGWSGQIPLATGPSSDITPSLAELRNNTVFVVWPRKQGTDYDLYAIRYARGQWTTPALLVKGGGDDYNPALITTDDGRLWLVWSRSTRENGGGDVYYKTYNGVTWSSEQILAAGPYEEKFPAITQTRDRRIWVLWESNSQGNARINYRIYDSISWTSTLAFTSTGDNDKWPTIAQDRSGTIWAFWARELRTQDPTQPYQWDLYYKTSKNNGAAWSDDTPLFEKDSTDDWHPSLTQGRDRMLWLVWNSDRPSLYGTHNLYLAKAGPIITHDLAVSIAITQDKPRSGEGFAATVRTSNTGDFTETTTLTVTMDGSTVMSKTIVLEPGQNVDNAITWPTAGRPLGAYTIQASLSQVAGENLPWDNNSSAKFHVVPGGDVERNGIVNISDLSLLGASFASKKGEAAYNPLADLNSNGVVDLFDLAAIGGTISQKTSLPPDFYLLAGLYYVQLAPGSSTDLFITVGQIAAHNSPVLLSISATGTSVTATFLTNPASLPGTSTLHFEAQTSASTGAFAVAVTGTDGTLTRSIPITLIIG